MNIVIESNKTHLKKKKTPDAIRNRKKGFLKPKFCTYKTHTHTHQINTITKSNGNENNVTIS